MTEKQPMSSLERTRKWQKKKLQKGLCTICGKRKLNLYAQRCDLCQKKDRSYRRKRLGASPWRKGGIGRPIRGKEADWSMVDWSMAVNEIARKLKVTPSAVYQRRAKMRREEGRKR